MTDFNLSGISWNKPTLKWSYTGSKPTGSEPSFHTEITEAFEKWDSVLNIDFQEATTQAEADIVLTFGPIDGAFGTVGLASSTFSGGFFVGQSKITFDSAESWSFSSSADSFIFSGSGTSTTFYAVALHEIGHTLGLDHPTNSSVIMSPTILPSVTDLTSFDIAGGRAIYGAETGQVDLDIATAIQLSSSSVKQGADVTVSYQVGNFGGADAAASTAGVYLSTDSTITTGDTLLATDAVAAIAAGGSVNDSVTIATGSIAPGNYFIGVIPDSNNLIAESNETNNASGALNFSVVSATSATLTTTQVNEIVKLYISYFSRAPEQDGLDFHKNAVVDDLNAGQTFAVALTERAEKFFEAALIQSDFTGYSESQTSGDFVTKLYSNILARPGIGGDAPTDSEKKFWTDQIDANTITRGNVVQRFLSDQDILVSQGTPEEKASATQAKALFDNRAAVGIEFAKPENSAGLTNAEAFNAGRAALDLVTSDPASVDLAIASFTTTTEIGTVSIGIEYSNPVTFDHDPAPVELAGVLPVSDYPVEA
ncbi:MAG: matrixin family metalloprotease [Hyphomicrobiaceae bacterium]